MDYTKIEKNKINVKKILKIKNTNKNIIMVGAYEERKGHDFLINAFVHLKKKYKKVNLIICGSKNNSYSKKLKKKCIFKSNYKRLGFFL